MTMGIKVKGALHWEGGGVDSRDETLPPACMAPYRQSPFGNNVHRHKLEASPRGAGQRTTILQVRHSSVVVMGSTPGWIEFVRALFCAS